LLKWAKTCFSHEELYGYELKQHRNTRRKAVALSIDWELLLMAYTKGYLGLELELGWVAASISGTCSRSLRWRACSARSCATAVDVNAWVNRYPERTPLRIPQKMVLFLLRPYILAPKTADCDGNGSTNASVGIKMTRKKKIKKISHPA